VEATSTDKRGGSASDELSSLPVSFPEPILREMAYQLILDFLLLHNALIGSSSPKPLIDYI
jgi:hypothetical protein